MKGFIRFEDNDESPRLLALSEIREVVVDDPYSPAQYARIIRKDGTSIKTSWRHNVDTIQALIAEAS